jgi:hypothetical protein
MSKNRRAADEAKAAREGLGKPRKPCAFPPTPRFVVELRNPADDMRHKMLCFVREIAEMWTAASFRLRHVSC